MIFGLFGIENDGVNLAVNLLVFFLVVIWLALVYWTYADANRRIEDPMLVSCATAAALFPFIGTIVYSIVRPPEYLEEARERDLEIRAAEARIQALESRTCRYCGAQVELAFLRCPSCRRKLKQPCRSCSKPLDPRWKVCPYCEADAVELAPAPTSSRGRRSTSREQAAERAARRAEARPLAAPSADGGEAEREQAPGTANRLGTT
jgi:hypothetical protein